MAEETGAAPGRRRSRLCAFFPEMSVASLLVIPEINLSGGAGDTSSITASTVRETSALFADRDLEIFAGFPPIISL